MTTKKITLEEALELIEPVAPAVAAAFDATCPPVEEEEHPTIRYKHPEQTVSVPQEQF